MAARLSASLGACSRAVEQGAAEIRRSAQIHVSLHFHDLGFSRIANRDLHIVFLSRLVATKRFPSGVP